MVAMKLQICCFALVCSTVLAASGKSAGRTGTREKHQPCGLPPSKLLAELNATVQDQLNKIWANYKNGTNCSTQLQQMKELFSANEDSRGSKKPAYGGWGGPTFLAGASDQVRSDFEKIAMNNSLSMNDKTKEIDAFMSKQSAELQSAYQKWKSDHKADIDKADAERAGIEKMIASKVGNLSAEAKAAYERMEKIQNNSTMNGDEKWMETIKLKATLSDAVADELMNLFSHSGSGKNGSGSRPAATHPPNSTKKPVKNSN